MWTDIWFWKRKLLKILLLVNNVVARSTLLRGCYTYTFSMRNSHSHFYWLTNIIEIQNIKKMIPNNIWSFFICEFVYVLWVVKKSIHIEKRSDRALDKMLSFDFFISSFYDNFKSIKIRKHDYWQMSWFHNN